MHSVPPLIPISDLRQRQNEILEQMSEGPVILLQRSKAAAVLVSPADWNALVDQIEDLEDTVAVLQAKLTLAMGEDELIDWVSVEAEVVPA